ncbi:aspartate--tRNA(Asn) ligase [Micromonospora peucetia]|uniref:Aspartate--tRNA(Asp/Asn) ligase n=1 Tax=Micromonospora peucetia TaxID=47871 RepID=A0A1C6VPK7_9ACTN|nr:aspartate--tRNA(Asn) ligase [Micromonospora peucetia]MCX4388647.1 aspartate--tRNA(Asn) ligase [Micromonospora peucetia]WSA30704.1 aspartate--tRNA(Asn) ligase [Micromonospora peucetia]SCL67870.1 nondiscriminating aspartyl-tRNA synthetase [Micromonospora peucetia]
MQRILSTQLSAHVGMPVRIAGWAHRRRLLKSVAFLIVRDAAGLAQVVVTDPAVRAEVEKLPEETVVEVTGTVVANPTAPAGVELTAPTVRPLGPPAEPPPFDLYRPALTASLPTQLDHAPVALRHPTRAAALRVSAAAVAGFRATLDARDFVEIHTPKVVGSSTESGANVFTLDWFGRPAYLAQSPQFYKQLMVGVFERVYEVGPVFRAEPHDTVRHLAQYTSLDAELGFVTDHRDVMAVLRHTVAGMLDAVRGRAGAALATLGVSAPDVPAEIPAVHFTEALRIAGAPADEPDLAPAHERALGEWARREHGSEFLFVTGYPMAKRPFYTHPDPARPAYSNGFDLLFRGLELVTGGQRLHRHADYLAALAARGEAVEPYAGYVDAFRHGMPPHGGFAIGLERFVARLTGAANVREVTAFPRDLHRLTP